MTSGTNQLECRNSIVCIPSGSASGVTSTVSKRSAYSSSQRRTGSPSR